MSIPQSPAEKLARVEQQAAHILVARRSTGTAGERLPDTCRPTDIASALRIQSAVSETWCELMDDSIGGWKCSLPPEGKLIVGPIYTRTIDSVPPVALWPGNDCARIEPELAFFFGVDLPARSTPYTPAEVDAAIARTHLALELINCRYSDPKACSFPEMLADGLVNQGLFVGPEVDAELARAASELAISITCATGEHSEHSGRHPNTHPRAPLYWLAEFLRSRGEGIVAGQVVITGSFAGVIDVPLNTDIEIHYAGLGTLSVNFTAKL
jgi:2-keto-4-pentenoate hydratase